MAQNILILGASGYIGSQLIPQLLDQGHNVVAAARQINYLHARTQPHPNLTIMYLDLEDREATRRAFIDIDTVYFLVHGMASGEDFIEYELSLAENVRAALQTSNVKHVIYLSAIQPQTGNSQHLEARRKTGEVLRKQAIPVTELRAGVIIGPGSAAYEIMRDFVYNLPILITPKHIDAKANPIALCNLNHYLLALIESPSPSHSVYEVGGPEHLSYRQQLNTLCELSHRPFRLFSTSLVTPKLASYWLSIITSVPKSIGQALIAGIEHDFLADNAAIQKRFPQQLLNYREAVSRAQAAEADFVKSEVWGFDDLAVNRWQSGYGYFAKSTQAEIVTQASLESLWQTVQGIGSRQHKYYFANQLWWLREWLDIFFGGGRPVRREPAGESLQIGDYIDSWKVIRCESPTFLSLLFGMKGPGLGRLEFSISEEKDNHRRLKIKAWWHPAGFRGLLYWFAMMPAHLFIFRGMAKAMVKHATEKDKKS